MDRVKQSKITKSSLIEKIVVSEETGEVVNQTTEVVYTSTVKSENFFMCIFENMAGFYNIKHASDARLLACLCSVAEFNTGVVRLSKKLRFQVCDTAKISVSNMSKNIQRLKELDLLTEDDGDIKINPNVFWKGTMKSRTELLKSPEGLLFSVRFVEPD